jgi:hypothetical protein
MVTIHRKRPTKQATSKQRLMSSAARCGPLDTLPRSAERSPSKADTRQQYEDRARPYQPPAADVPLPELQPGIRQSAPRPPPEDAEPDRSHDRLIKKSEAQELLGGCSHMTLKRLLVSPTTAFPRPIYLGRHPHFWRNDILRWITAQAATSQQQKSPQADNLARYRAARRAAKGRSGHG